MALWGDALAWGFSLLDRQMQSIIPELDLSYDATDTMCVLLQISVNCWSTRRIHWVCFPNENFRSVVE